MRKTLHILFSVVLTMMVTTSCKKEITAKISGTSALTLVNGVASNPYFITDFNGDQPNSSYYSKMNTIAYGAFSFFNSYSGTQKLALYKVPDTTANSKPVFNLSLDLPVNDIHTLFLMGTPQDPDQLFLSSKLPDHLPADSVMGIRFIHMSKGSPPVTVNLAGKPNGSEADNLNYKTITAFKNYAAHTKISSYTFEFRDKATGQLLGTCLIDGVNNSGGATFPNIRRNKNFTLAFLAASGGGAPDRVLIIDEKIYN